MKKYKYAVLVCVILVTAVLEMLCGYLLGINPIGDVDAVYSGAMSRVNNGSIGSYIDYFYVYPHNLGGLYFYTLLFSLFKAVGITNYFVVATVTNVVLMQGIIVLVFLVCDKLFGVKKAMLSLVLFFTCLPLYLYIPVFYTDIPSMFTIALGIYLFTLYKMSGSKFRFIYWISASLCLAVGAEFKMTTVIVLVAAIIEVLFTSKLKQSIPAVLSAFLCVGIIFNAFNYYTYNFVLDKETAEKNSAPYVHWVMMGLKGNGTFNEDDYWFTYSFDDPEERKQADIAEIKNRLSAYGVPGYVKLLGRKMNCSFGSGTYGVEDMIRYHPRHKNALHQIFLEKGKYFSVFVCVAQVFYWFLLLSTVLAAVRNIKKKPLCTMPTAFLALFGLFMFLMLWESNARYIYNFVPLLILCAVSGADIYKKILNKIKGESSNA